MTRSQRPAALTLSAPESGVHAAWILAWAVFVAASVWAIGVARAEGVPPHVHEGFVASSPELVAHDPPSLPHLTLHPAMSEPAVQLGASWTLRTRAHPTLDDELMLHIEAARAPDRVGIGRTVHLGRHRELVLDLTPSPRHCAPLVGVTF